MLESTVAYSDIIDVQEEQSNTRLVQYSNENDYAGISYSTVTKPVFSFRVVSKFFKTREPNETEGISLSDNSVVVLSDNLKTQKLLQTEPMPAYMHEILNRALKHNYVLIDGELWSKEEGYERKEPEEKAPFELAECWLTHKEEGYLTNVFGTVTP